MTVDREELKRMIDQMHEEDTVEVYDFVGYLRMKREREDLNVDLFADDKELIDQIKKSREERKNGCIYDKETGLKYLHSKIEDFEHGQNL